MGMHTTVAEKAEKQHALRMFTGMSRISIKRSADKVSVTDCGM